MKTGYQGLAGKSIFLATPMFGGMASGMYLKSCLELQEKCVASKIPIQFSFIFNESLITRARNYLVDEFLRADAFTHLLFVDSDIVFNPDDILTLLSYDFDVVGAPYPKKRINWKIVKEAVSINPSISDADLELLTGDFVFNPVPGAKKISITEPVEVMEIGTGCMLIKRATFERFRSAYPDQSYYPDHLGSEHFGGGRKIHAFFDTVIDRKHEPLVSPQTEKMTGSDRYLSEDAMFCQFWRRIGGKIWLCPWMKTWHVGTYHYAGDLRAIAEKVGRI